MTPFEPINQAYNNVFKPQRLSIGLVVPIENYATSAVPSMQQHVARVQLIEKLGFLALWIRDVPFNVPSFGDAGQTFDPFTYLGYLAAQTSSIALGVSSIALPLHQPVHVAKSAATIDQLSSGRMLMGVASGDRYQEYPAMNIDFDSRGRQFRDAFNYIRQSAKPFPKLSTTYYGELKGDIDVLPKPLASKIPMLITGNSRQTLKWNAEHGDGWMSYPRHILDQANTIKQWRDIVLATSEHDKPFMQPLYVDLLADDDAKPQPIDLGIKTGINYLIDYLYELQHIGVNHVALNLRFNNMEIEKTLEKLAVQVLPCFHTPKGMHINKNDFTEMSL